MLPLISSSILFRLPSHSAGASPGLNDLSGVCTKILIPEGWDPYATMPFSGYDCCTYSFIIESKHGSNTRYPKITCVPNIFLPTKLLTIKDIYPCQHGNSSPCLLVFVQITEWQSELKFQWDFIKLPGESDHHLEPGSLDAQSLKSYRDRKYTLSRTMRVILSGATPTCTCWFPDPCILPTEDTALNLW